MTSKKFKRDKVAEKELLVQLKIASPFWYDYMLGLIAMMDSLEKSSKKEVCKAKR